MPFGLGIASPEVGKGPGNDSNASLWQYRVAATLTYLGLVGIYPHGSI